MGGFSSHPLQNFNRLSSVLERTPPELLSEIFLWTLPLTREAARRAKFHATDSPWVLTHVNRRWRAIAISNPSLLSLVTIKYLPSSNPTFSFPLLMVGTQIARARQLRIHFHGCETADSLPKIAVFQCLAAHASRWEELCLLLTSQRVPLLAGLRDRVPLLQRLLIEWDQPKSQAGMESIDCFETAPSLVDAGVSNTFRSIPFRVPVQQLTRYQFDGPWEMHRRILLQVAPSLIEARIIISFDNDPWPNPDGSGIIDLTSLRRLCVTHPDILNYIRTPRLEEIAVHFAKEEEKALPTYFVSILSRSRCPLRKLCLVGEPAAHPTADILRNIPSIVELSIIISPRAADTAVDAFISHFASSQAASLPFPSWLPTCVRFFSDAEVKNTSSTHFIWLW
ncbi:F-box domain-containing protein [Mycena venus]|uniref:F-box domain-containing protein n=1 Tax=Mycena venus TaxID=2733690 RepID=A0A8H7CGD3_9AGAR|nr:F-box domain-containing protein [Mycena venus]